MGLFLLPAHYYLLARHAIETNEQLKGWLLTLRINLIGYILSQHHLD
jgi:hypothetical protein